MNSLLYNDGIEKVVEIKASVLKIRGKTLIFKNSIYQISNISALNLIDLSTVKPIPKYFLVLLVAGVALLLLPSNGSRMLGVVILGALGWLFYQYYKDKQRVRFGVEIRMNSGSNTVIVSDDLDFLKQVMLVLYNIINTDELKALNLNINQRQIHEDKSVHIERMTGSNFVLGNVAGDIVTNV